MARTSDARPKWAEDFLKNLQAPTDEELAKRHAALEWARANQIDIRPMTTTELIRRIREKK